MPNRLIHATSPYLLQHAHNPVDWHPWGEEAIGKAIREDKPLLVSIGYSACHWCHVMERESFEDKAIAALMNEHFVCIKVDREERPDVDQVYMEAVQSLGVNGGWPLNVFLTPSQKPFFGGTYFPPPQWKQLLAQINIAFKEKRKDIEESSGEITTYLNRNDLERFATPEPTTVQRAVVDKMFDILKQRFDRVYGGMDKAPKFVMPTIWQFLLRYHQLTGSREALDMVKLTLEKMAAAGLFDQIGGGFARYSVDGRWFAPHFEKMLYDNAQLLSLYGEAFQATGKSQDREIVMATVGWLEREMKNERGGFYSALDADSEGVEGKFYTWTYDEFGKIFGGDAEEAARMFGVTREGNWEHGTNILMTETPGTSLLSSRHRELLEARGKKIRPGLDDKILAGWNGMVIKGLVDAWAATGEERCLTLAVDAMTFVEQNMMQGDIVYRSYKGKRGDTQGFLEDYAFILSAYVVLYQATFRESYIKRAGVLCAFILDEFFDEKENYFHYTSRSAEKLIARKKEVFDNVIPSSNSVMAQQLLRLSVILDRPDWRVIAEKMTGRLTQILAQEPSYLSNWGVLATELINGIAEVAIVGPDYLRVRKEFGNGYQPFAVFMGTSDRSDLPLLHDKKMIGNNTTIYVCFNKVCKLPVTSVSAAIDQLVKGGGS